MKNGFSSTSRLTAIVIAILCTAGVAVAASGAATRAIDGGGDGATARGSQQPLGSLSSGSVGDQVEGGSPAPLDLDEPEGGGTQGDREESDGPIGTASGSSSPSAAGAAPDAAPVSTGGGSGSLPFTGYLAIPVLLLGAVMLGAGVALRRRSAPPSTSS
jgi:hypothetical protein